MLTFGAIGFYDDYLKVTKQTHAGVSGKVRIVIEVLIAAVACYFISCSIASRSRARSPPVLQGAGAAVGWFFVAFGAFIIGRRQRGEPHRTGSTASPSCR